MPWDADDWAAGLPPKTHPVRRGLVLGGAWPLLMATRGGRELMRREFSSADQKPRKASPLRVADTVSVVQEAAAPADPLLSDVATPEAQASARWRKWVTAGNAKSASIRVGTWLGTLLTLTIAGVLAALIYGYMTSH